MKKFMVVILLSVFLVGCQQPAAGYKKAVNQMHLLERMQEIELNMLQDSQSLNTMILSNQAYPSFEAKLEALGYDALNNNIEETKKTLDQIMIEIDNLNPSDEAVEEAHENLLNAFAKYQSINQRMGSTLKVTKDLEKMLFEVQELNVQALEVSFSGNPTSELYKKALDEFMRNNKDSLYIMDVDVVNEVLDKQTIDEKELNQIITKAKKCNASLKALKTYNETDRTIQEIILKMYQKITDMYIYIADNKQDIEWTNGYDTFAQFYEEQDKVIRKNLEAWEVILK